MINLKKIINFLEQLEENNNREWYHAHKKERQEAMKEFEDFIQELIISIGEYDDSILFNNPKDLTFKMVRDTRFSADKSPYNPSFRAHISAKGKLPIPVGYFICIRPHDQTILGGGLFADMFKDATTMMRDYLLEHGEEFDHIVKDPEFVKHFHLDGTQLKKVPRGYDPEHPFGEYLKYKCWFVEYAIPDRDMNDGDAFVKQATEIFRFMKPFNDYLNKAMKDFVMPQRP